MYETAIEKAEGLKKIDNIDWNKYAKMPTLPCDNKKTIHYEILKRIALAVNDRDRFFALDAEY